MALKTPLSLRASRTPKPKAPPLRPAWRAPATDASAMRPTGRWALAGGGLGVVLALLFFAPAAWLTGAIERATGGRLLLAEPEGTLWSGSALPVLTGGAGSRDAAVLPSRLGWSLAPFFGGLRLKLAQDCCVAPGLAIELRPGWGQLAVTVVPAAGETVGQWPAAWLEGLGAPWNTLKPGGQLRVATRGLTLRSGKDNGAWQLEGQAELDLLQASSRLSTLDPLGSYRIRVAGQPGAPTTLILNTLDGALQLNGTGELGGRNGLRFRGDARAAPGFEPALNNLLNIIGRRNGALSVISIG